MPITLTKPSPCPACGRILSALGGDGEPRPGDLSVCAYCLVYLEIGSPTVVLSNKAWLALEPETRQELVALREQLRLHWPR